MSKNAATKSLAKIDPNALATQSEVAAHVGVSPRALEAWRLRGEGPPFIRLSRRLVRYRPADVDAWIEQHVVPQERNK